MRQRYYIRLHAHTYVIALIETDFEDKVFRGVTVVAYLPGLEAYPGLEIVQPRVGSLHLVTTHALLL